MEQLYTILEQTALQLLAIFGIFMVLGILLGIIQKETHKRYRTHFGWRGILWTAWIGTPIHEFGHIVFAKLFRHKLEHVAIFQPNKETGGLGHVEHSYNKRSIYQQIGNFFVGAAPLLFGGIFIYLLLVFLVPAGGDVIAALTQATTLTELPLQLVKALTTLFSADNLTRWDFWLFLYVSFAIVSHMGPSKPDQKGMWKGFGWIVLIVFLLNILLSIFNTALPVDWFTSSSLFSTMLAISLYALLLGVLHYIVITVLTVPFRVFVARR